MQVHIETLQLELRLVKEELHRLTLEHGERVQRAKKLSAKHATIVAKHAFPEGEQRSQVLNPQPCPQAPAGFGPYVMPDLDLLNVRLVMANER